MMFLLKSFKKLENIYTDQTGQFPYKSSQGYRDIIIAYHSEYQNNLCHPLSNCKGVELKTSYQNIREELVQCSLTLNYHFLDNEVSKTLKDYMKPAKKKMILYHQTSINATPTKEQYKRSNITLSAD